MSAGGVKIAVLVLAGFLGGALGSAALSDLPGGRPESSRSAVHDHEVDALDAEAHDHGDMAAMEHNHGGLGHSHVTNPFDLQEWDPAAAPDLSHEAPFPLETGTIPSLDEARSFAKKYSRFVAKGDEGIDKLRAEGYLSGDGTKDSPYVLEKFFVDGELSLTSLHRAIIVRDGYVSGQFKLNYVGEDLYVHHVYAKDLRVNENVKRTGANTGGLFHDNKFAFVGQIRHFTGEFRNNEVGPRPGDVLSDYAADSGVLKVPTEVVFNFDGFHTADVHHNKFLGQVDMKLHGHNHGDCFTCGVHNHADPMDAGHENHSIGANGHGFESIHSVRYTSLRFHDNEIQVPGGVALRYNDRNHAGDDRTANSEPNERLEDNHVHYQDITIERNKLLGGMLQIDIFNAADDRHPVQNRGILRLLDNDATVHYKAPSTGTLTVFGVHVRAGDGVELRAEDNTVRFRDQSSSQPGGSLTGLLAGKVELRGMQLDTVDASNITIAKNVVESGRFGVYALRFTDSTHWWLRQNDFRTTEPWRGQDVANPPEEK